MRKLFVLAAVLGSGFGLGIVLVGIPMAARAGVGGAGPVVNGDTNGDGTIDISDAVYLLVHLFKGGAEPVACADSPELLERVAMLEAQVVALQEDSAIAVEGIEGLGARINKMQLAPALVCANLIAGVVAPCTGQAFGQGPGDFRPMYTEPWATIIQGGEFVREGGALEGPATSIRFETDRAATLLIEIDFTLTGSASAMVTLLVDSEYGDIGGSVTLSPSSVDKGTARGIWFAVPAGAHSLSVTGACACGITSCSARMEIPYLEIRYLE